MSDTAVELILASSSPRRRELLRQAGYRFKVRPPCPIEDACLRRAPSAAAYVESLAYLKAMSAIETHGIRKGLVLGADTAVELQGRLIGKPRDEDEARQILSALAGSVHRVLTGLALVDAGAGRSRRTGTRRGERWLAHDATTVHMGPMSAAEIHAYVASGEAMGKAGAYALQETGDRFVESLEGSFTNVVGLPMELLERMLKAAGHDPKDFRDVD
ncbi:MAG: Maf family protein [Phycisphaerae bacterium]